MSGYGSVPQSGDDVAEREVNFVPQWLLSFMEGNSDPTSAQREAPTERAHGNENSKMHFKVNPESCRFIAYVFFWSMCAFAIAMTKLVVGPQLLAGPKVEGDTCAPFDGNKSHGFDVQTESHLMDAFGFNNICMNWDYSPSREATAMVYPLFEYSLLFYLILDFTLAAISYKKGYLSARYWKVAQIAFPFQIILCAWFRMIFVIAAYDWVQGHTAGFLGLQIVLVSVACLNTAYVLETQASYGFLGGLQGTRIAGYTFIICDLLISGVKVYLSSYVVFGLGLTETGGHTYPPWALGPVVGNMVVGQAIDLVWMIFNAVLPLIISFIRSKSEPPISFTIDLGKPNIVG